MSEPPGGPTPEEQRWYASSGSHTGRDSAFAAALERVIFGHRALLIVLFIALTIVFTWVAVKGLHIDASFTKQLPKRHEYMQTYLAPEVAEFRGANRVLIGLIARDGNMFQPQFFEALKAATDEVLVMDGIDRGRVQSLYTPNVRYLEVVEDGIEAGNVVPADFRPTPEGLAQVRENILKAGIVGRLVANDFSGALVSAIVLEEDAQGRRVDPIRIASELEARVRQKIQGTGVAVQATGVSAEIGAAGAGSAPGAAGASGPPGVDVQIIGFAKVMGDIAEGALSVIVFAAITLVLTLLAVWVYCQSLRIALIPVMCSVVAVVWQLGVLVILGYGIDPLGLLVPFLIFAIGVSHGVQKISAVKEAAFFGMGSMEAARRTFRQLLAPAVVALLADLVGFITILLIPVQVIREMAVTASLGVAIVILTDLVLLPVLVSFVGFDDGYRARVNQRQLLLSVLWKRLAKVTNRVPSLIIIAAAVLLAIVGAWKGRETPIGDTQAGVPELRPNSRYNLDTDIITSKFSIGVDILTVIVETEEPACVSFDLMSAIDRFGWHMQNVEGVQDVITLPFIAKTAIAGWNEGSLKWRNIPREQAQLTQSTRYIETSTGLLNADCNVVPVMLFLRDHRAETIERAVAAVKDWRAKNPTPGAQFKLAAGNVGVMAATNEEVKAKEFPILGGVFLAVIVMCLITFRSVLGTVLVVVPLALVSVLVYAVMAIVGIGLKLSTLPMVALGAGIGVDYGIYLFSRMQLCLKEGLSVHDAYERTLRVTGSSIIFTGITLAIGVVTWVFSPLKFQADIGVMLTFMFLVNMLAAIILLPALATWLVKTKG
ncbi:MAG TPA: MMPL family transporter [Steroidobacteraceae bacterium]|nr:MMPL family transporter [Steroidobacteraceae bacterium]